jgi:hypothetical protein
MKENQINLKKTSAPENQNARRNRFVEKSKEEVDERNLNQLND